MANGKITAPAVPAEIVLTVRGRLTPKGFELATTVSPPGTLDNLAAAAILVQAGLGAMQNEAREKQMLVGGRRPGGLADPAAAFDTAAAEGNHGPS